MKGNIELQRNQSRATAGFTLMEVLLAVAVLVILMSVGFVAVQDYQRSVKQTELNVIAKEIYIAAQNHLTAAESQGTIDELHKQETAAPAVSNPMGVAKMNDSGHTYYYWFVGAGVDPASTAPSTLSEMLPYGAIDETVRVGGSYVIQYDIEPATIINVFYSDQTGLSKVNFTEEDYSSLFSNYVGDDKNNARFDGYKNNLDDGKSVIGWYGGDDLDSVKPDSSKPVLELINAEKLQIKVSFSGGRPTFDGATLKLFIYGNTSKHTQLINGSSGELISTIGEFTANGSKTYTLDDITSDSKKHFAEQFCTGENALIPGEDITVYAVVDSVTALVRIAQSNSVHANSLFDRMETDKGTSKPHAVISNIRHLENLDTSISGYLSDSYESLKTDASTSVKQIADLRWAGNNNSFTERIAAGGGSSASSVQIYSVANPGTPSEPGTFAPVKPAILVNDSAQVPFDYDGGRHGIYKVKVDTSGPAGIFSDLPVAGSSVKHLELIDCEIKSSGSNAGTLLAATSTDKLNFTDVLVHDYDGKAKSQVTISSSGDSAGGLIGKISVSGTDGIIIDSCASSVYVKTEATDSYAGGLIGYSSGKVAITNSYVGGHTKHDENGVIYDKEKMNVDASSSNGCAAGGFIGYMKGGSVEYCYTTASVSAKNKTGGFIGDCDGATIKDTYATGLVVGDTGDSAKTGAYFGEVASNVTLNGKNQYYSIINNDMAAIGEGDDKKVTALDENLETFNQFYLGEKGNGTLTPDDAKPYDSVLTGRYGEKYPLHSIRQLNSGDTSSFDDFFITTHYGDYPDPITYVINKSSTSGAGD